MASRQTNSRDHGGLTNTPVGRAAQARLIENGRQLGGLRSAAADVLGKLWNAPNTALGLGYGLAGYAAGQLNRMRPGDQPNDPRIQVGNNAVEFVDNPFGGGSAVTIGNAIVYSGDPYDPNDERWNAYRAQFGHDVRDHERQHTYQGQQLGPFYLPSNAAGGLLGLARARNWHDRSNWNERGPQETPPRAWSK